MKTPPMPSYLALRIAAGLPPKGGTQSTLERHAVHEAGHFVFCKVCRFPVQRLSIVPDGKHPAHCLRVILDRDLLLENEKYPDKGIDLSEVRPHVRAQWPAIRGDFIRRRLVVAVAGTTAVNILHDDIRSMDGVDLETAEEMAALLNPSEPFVEMDRAQTFVANEYMGDLGRAVRGIAEVLRNEKTLVRHRLDHLWEEFKPDGTP